MSLSRRRKKHEEPEHEGPDERWMASYMDMVTVLMCLFIVLFAMSAVDQDKYVQLRNSLATGFGQVESEETDVSAGVVVPAELVEEEGEGFTDIELALEEVEELEELREQIRSSLAASGLEHTVSFTIDERGLTVRLVGSETFFDTNSIALAPTAIGVLNASGPPIATSPYSVSIEGHADGRPAMAPYPTNWELASGRATAVLRYLVEATGVPATRIGAVGFGSARPLVEEVSPEAQATNRRVDIVVLSALPEAVRSLIPGLVAEGAG
ncbi:flagellar motor protein MotB [Salinibacterium sp. SYSU T00001]|uniref:OmpA/MotB family protein n=1 Tax=Homoserinimonas sedimenticola TaxID=2986805 RepID=UPI002235679E|nr:flagellar motor protein MotB [Salinibacterium sedimenticola]MCW4385725.1 flagellar motor protein MotB [Salinibacterium sedimenticola]